MKIPNWYELLLLGLAAWRTWVLLAEDTILDAPRAWTVYGVRKWRDNKTAEYVREFIECPRCLGFWVAIGWVGAWQLWPHGTLVVAAFGAVSAVVAIIGWAISG